ncbi:MAG: 4-(cytidine 5'-diphospho)-2-C-methyl-D-erythritol kinase [Syntrophomonadaceae bacterium]|nr:4-(cytidine 5'-diphospho)-2-C-methyl-D-erythritol kinase [Syntrophomonadaceae bacterium]
MATQVILDAPAKINLTLDIKGKRPDGYHELETVMHQINLADKITITQIPEGIEVSSNCPELPAGEGNLAYKAAWTILDKHPGQGGVAIHIEKAIPIGAGLAGGSTDAAATLKGINALYKLDLSPRQLMSLALEIGSDVPFCLQGGTALARGRGEKLESLPLNMNFHFLLVKPSFSVSTAEVYSQFDLSQVNQKPDTRRFLEGWHHCDIISVCHAMENVLETVTAVRYPEIESIKKRLVKLGALKALMSGSGPTVFGLFRDKASARQAWFDYPAGEEKVFLVTSYDGRKANGRETSATGKPGIL